MPNEIFKKSLLASAIALVASSAAFAQEEPATEELIVTGIRASVQRAMDIKRESAGVVDAISAEDIGKFPDSNLAESLQRITGVSIDRANGEGQQVTVRGFGPQYNLITLNGRAMPAGQLNPEGGLINQRSFDMSNLASETISGVEVYKTGKANVSSGGIGATINIITGRPMDSEGFKGTIGAKALYDTTNIAGNEITPEISGLISWSNDMFGASFAASYQERDSMNAGLRPNIGNGWNNVSGGYSPAIDGFLPTDVDGNGLNDDVNNGFVANGLIRDDAGNILSNTGGATEPAAGVQTSFPNGPSFFRADFHRVRENTQVVLQYRPIESITATLDYTLAEQESTMQRSGTSFWFGGTFPTKAVQYTETGVAESPLRWWTENPSTINIDGDVVSGVPRDVATGIQVVHVRNVLESTGLNVEWEVNDRLNLSFDAHNSSTESLPGPGSVSNNINASFGYQGVSAQGLDFSGDLPLLVGVFNDSHEAYTHGGGATPGVIEQDDLSSTVGQINYDRIWVDLNQYKLEGEFQLTDDIGIDFGVERTEFESIQKSTGGQNVTLAGGWSATNTGDVPAGLVHEIDYADYFDDYRTELSAESRQWFESNQTPQTADEIANGVPHDIRVATQGWMSGNTAQLAESMFVAAGQPFSADHFPDGTSRSLVEEITAYYIQGDLHFDIADMPLDVLAGVRYESTDVTSDALNAATTLLWAGDNDFSTSSDITNSNQIIATASYDHVLPALDVSLGITDDIKARFSYSTTMARADYDQLSEGLAGIGGPVNGPTILTGRPGGATNGNTSLAPIESDNIDLSVEWYFGDASYASVGYFKKEVPNFIGIATIPNVTADFTRDPSNGPRAIAARQALLDGGFDANSQQNLFAMIVAMSDPDDGSAGNVCIDADPAIATCGVAFNPDPNAYPAVETGADIVAVFSGPDQDPLSTLNVNQVSNANDADLDGFEFAVQHFFGDTGFGLAANYTLVEGSGSYDNSLDPSNSTQFALVGLSDSANLIGMYENNGIQARVTYNWRDEFLYSANVGSNEPGNTEAYAQLDFNVSYAVSDNLSVGIEGINILAEDRRTFGRNTNQALRLEIFDARYALSARYTF